MLKRLHPSEKILLLGSSDYGNYANCARHIAAFFEYVYERDFRTIYVFAHLVIPLITISHFHKVFQNVRRAGRKAVGLYARGTYVVKGASLKSTDGITAVRRVVGKQKTKISEMR